MHSSLGLSAHGVGPNTEGAVESPCCEDSLAEEVSVCQPPVTEAVPTVKVCPPFTIHSKLESETHSVGVSSEGEVGIPGSEGTLPVEG
jgi:hypothetical protein